MDMSTATVVLPGTPTASVPFLALRNDVQKAESWFKVHERLILVIAFLLATVFLANKYINYAANNADAKANASAQQLVLDQAQLNDLKARLATDEATSAAQLVALTNANQVLSAALANNAAALAKQQAQVPQLSPTQLSAAWQAEIKLPNVVPSVNGYTVGAVEAIATVQKLELADALVTDKANLQSTVENDQKQIVAIQKVSDDKTAVIAQQTTTIADGTKACDAKVDALKADQRKKSRNWFIKGAATTGAVALYLFLHFH